MHVCVLLFTILTHALPIDSKKCVCVVREGNRKKAKEKKKDCLALLLTKLILCTFLFPPSFINRRKQAQINTKLLPTVDT
jgi:hypothetical protein